MAIKKITKTERKNVKFLVDVDPEYVSLVAHAASRQPFRVVKNEKEGGDAMSMVVQSILVPKHVNIEDLQKKDDLQWLSDARMDRIEDHEEYSKVVQMEEVKFDPESFSLKKIDDSGAYAVTGELVNKSDMGTALTMGEAKKAEMIHEASMQTVVATIPSPVRQVTFGDLFYKELDAFLEIVRGSLTQSSPDYKKRKKTILDALKAFESFLSIGLDNLKSASVEKFDKSPMGVRKEEKKEMYEFSTEEDFKGAVEKLVDEKLAATQNLQQVEKDEKMPEENKEAPPVEEVAKNEKPPAEKKTPEKKEEVAKEEKDDTLKVLLSKLDSLATKVDKLEKQPASDPAAAVSEEGKPVNKSENASVFSGLLIH